MGIKYAAAFAVQQREKYVLPDRERANGCFRMRKRLSALRITFVLFG